MNDNSGLSLAETLTLRLRLIS